MYGHNHEDIASFLNRCEEKEYDDKDEAMLLELLNHPEELVRTSAADVLWRSTKENTMQLLLKKAKEDPSYLVRGYAGLSAMDVAEAVHQSEAAIQTLQRLFLRERSKWVQLCWLPVILPQGDSPIKQYAGKMINDGLRSKNRHIRNLAVMACAESLVCRELGDQAVISTLKKEEKIEYIRNHFWF